MLVGRLLLTCSSPSIHSSPCSFLPQLMAVMFQLLRPQSLQDPASSHPPHLTHSNSCWPSLQNVPSIPPLPAILSCCHHPFSPGLLPWPSKSYLVTSPIKVLQGFPYLTGNKTPMACRALYSLCSPHASLPSSALPRASHPRHTGLSSYLPSCAVFTYVSMVCLPVSECDLHDSRDFFSSVFCCIPRAQNS